MTFSKYSPPNTSPPSLGEQLRMQRQLQQESRSSTSDNAAEEGASLSSSGPRSFTAASVQLRMQRQFEQEARSSAPDNAEDSDCLRTSGLRSSTAAPRGSHRASRSRNNLRSILDLAIAILDEDDEEAEATVVSSRCDDSNSQS
jgi:hypothetical protein